MSFKHTFRHVDPSEALKTYVEERFEKMGKHLLKESQWQIFYSLGKVNFEVEVLVRNPDSHFKAKAQSPSVYAAVDLVAEKLDKQFMKRKEKLQHHKKFERSRGGQLERVNEKLEYDNTPYSNKKPA
ncbi:MAG: ribosome-associated translation inhibitor RaiA [Proteobacteria bacterium]|jgi:putative sigma-54 modulation protein|nr:ribosome-associated translation inhibitor RaiA [Pseudomonadota bacterium]